MNDCSLFISILLLLLAGCAGAPTQPPAISTVPDAMSQGATSQEAPSQEEPSPDAFPQDSVLPQSGEGIVAEPEPKPVMSGNPAVIALLDRARLDSGAGKREVAGVSLERALRIEPRNAWLWNELAQLRLAQGQYAQAITLAQKSNSFSGRERRLQAANWQVIGNARVALGDSTGAEQAFRFAAELAQTARSESAPEPVPVPAPLSVQGAETEQGF